jgi:hypothetical protein
MDQVAVIGTGRTVGGGSDERVRELDAPSNVQQTGVHCRIGGGHVDTEPLRGTLEQHRIAERLRGRGEHEQLRIRGQ